METHHPHHVTHKKNFKEYFLEFLMIFLAVFLGFIAENIRENTIEHKRAQQYGELLATDLKRDTAWFNSENKRWLQQQSDFDTLIDLLIQPVAASDEVVLKKLLHINYVSNAKMNTATYSQMKTSGSLRYINNIRLTTALEEYYEIQLPRTLEISQATTDFFSSYIRTFFIDHLRNQDMKSNADTAKNWSPMIFGRNREADQRLSNIINMAKTQLDIANRFYKSANSKAAELIALLNTEYHLE